MALGEEFGHRPVHYFEAAAPAGLRTCWEYAATAARSAKSANSLRILSYVGCRPEGGSRFHEKRCSEFAPLRTRENVAAMPVIGLLHRPQRPGLPGWRQACCRSQHHQTEMGSPRDRFGATVGIELGEDRRDMELGSVERDS